jgi:hypothetical protein
MRVISAEKGRKSAAEARQSRSIIRFEPMLGLNDRDASGLIDSGQGRQKH